MTMRGMDVSGNFAGVIKQNTHGPCSSRGWRELTQPQQVIGAGAHETDRVRSFHITRCLLTFLDGETPATRIPRCDLSRHLPG